MRSKHIILLKYIIKRKIQMKKLAILSSLLLLVMNSCSNEEIFNGDLSVNLEKRISVVAEDLTPANGTRTTYTEGENGYHFAWSEGDALGIFPENGYQTSFPINAGKGVGTNTAVFDGGDWALKANKSYAAYYPLIHDFDLEPTAIPVDYTGQVQNGNGSTAHISAYDYMASGFTAVDAKGNVNFKLQHLGCLVQFKLTMPEADIYSFIEITSDNVDFITSAEYSLSDNSHTFKNIQTSNRIKFGLNSISTTEEEKTLTITAMFAPVDLTGCTLTLRIDGKKHTYIFEVEGQDLTHGKTVSKESDSVGTDDTPYVTFHAEEKKTFSMSRLVPTLEYSVDNGEWTLLGTTSVAFGGDLGDLRLRGKSSYGTAESTSDCSNVWFGSGYGKVSCDGDIRTLVDYENYENVDTSNARFCYLFASRSDLISAPEMPATSLADHCYEGMFNKCVSLKSGPSKLPAMTLAEECYRSMFAGCSTLGNVPELPATTLARACYSEMFTDCNYLTSVQLPAITLAEECYYRMFKGCVSLSSAQLSATTLAKRCCYGMFNDCISLTSVSDLVAREFEEECYRNMFSGCRSLTKAPELSAETSAPHCCTSMFAGCSSLIYAPSSLPAPTLEPSCYSEMFRDCTNLINAPKLPATTLAGGCYEQMFSNCKSLEIAPELPATTLSEVCYEGMFYGCTKLNYVKMMAIDTSAILCLSSWLDNVSPSGTFVKNSDAIWDNTGVVPSGWEVRYEI